MTQTTFAVSTEQFEGPAVSLGPLAPLHPSRFAAAGFPPVVTVWFSIIEYAVFSPASAYCRARRSAALTCEAREFEVV